MILDEALTWVVQQINSNIDEGVLGTDATTVQETDTGLMFPDATTETSVTTTISDNQLTFSFNKYSTVGSGTTYKEYGLRDDTNGVDWTRYVFTPLQASSSEDWYIKVRMFVDRL